MPPFHTHLTTLAQQTVVERFITSWYGSLEYDTFLVAENANHRIDYLGFWWSFNFFVDDRGHGRSHRWYSWTASPNEADSDNFEDWDPRGFSLSPLVTGNLVLRPWGNGGGGFLAVSAAAPAPSPPPLAIAGFSTFGSVSEVNGIYTITEQANAGITKTVTIPIGASAFPVQIRDCG